LDDFGQKVDTQLQSATSNKSGPLIVNGENPTGNAQISLLNLKNIILKKDYEICFL
jgi:hypothetical protein